MNTFAYELTAAAQELAGGRAINHGRLSDCNFGDTTDRCLEIGLGRDSYDCSGFVIRSLSRVMGRKVEDWPADMRHVRQMAVRSEAADFGDVRIGQLLIFGRTYTISGIDQVVPGHMGLVASMSEEDLTFIHASMISETIEYDCLQLDDLDAAGKLLGIINPDQLVKT